MENMEKLSDQELLQAAGGLLKSYMGATADSAGCEQFTDKSSCSNSSCKWDKDHLMCIKK